jgi:hypothetical protein
MVRAHPSGVSGRHSLSTYGVIPVGSHNLSCHSFPIQKRLASILGQLPASAPVNLENWFSSINYIEQWSKAPMSEFIELSLDELEEGKKFLIDVVQGGILGNPQPAFRDQESIFAARRRSNGQSLDRAEMARVPIANKFSSK